MIRAAIIAAVLAAPVTADVVIQSDMGGNVDRYAARVAALRASGEPVRIVGSCGSACTMLIGLPAACVARTARLGFHGATGRGQFAAIAEAAANGTLAAHYPPAVARLFWARWSRVRGGQIYWITGEQMIGMGVREC